MAFFSNARFANKTLILLLLGGGFFLLSCLSEKQSAKKINSQKEEVLVPPSASAETPALSSTESEEAALDDEKPQGAFGNNNNNNYQTKYQEVETSSSASWIVKQIRAQLNAGAYEAVLELTEKQNTTEDYYLKTYYRGIAYFAMSSQTHLYSLTERLTYADLAEELLLEVGSEANEDALRAKGLLWYGVALDMNRKDLKSKRKAIGAFWNIQTTALKDTSVYNDSLLYAAEAYSKMGWYGVARNYYNKLEKANENDNRVYDYVDNRFYDPFEAAQRGKERLAQYLAGTYPTYK